jgi:hypothetical protein
MPRALEIASTFLNDPKRVNQTVDKAFISDLYTFVFKEARGKYKLRMPDPVVIFAMFFREAITVDEELLKACMNSFVTNPITVIDKDSNIVPDASLVLLRVACENSSKPYGRAIFEGINAVIDTLCPGSPARLAGDTQDKGGAEKGMRKNVVGDVLEEVVFQALRVRVALSVGKSNMTLARLCGLSDSTSNIDEQRTLTAKIMNQATADALFAPLDILTLKARSDDEDRISSLSYTSPEAFLRELDGVQVSKVEPVRVLRSAPSESWDVCVKVLNAATEQPFYVFFECKSGAEFAHGQSDGRILDVLSDSKQYKHTKDVLGPSRSFLYVYCSSHVGMETETLPATDDDSGDLPSRAIVLGRTGTLDLVGPFSEIYRVARAAYGADLTESPRTGPSEAKKGNSLKRKGLIRSLRRRSQKKAD